MYSSHITRILYVTSKVQRVQVYQSYWYTFYNHSIWYNNKTMNLYCSCTAEASASIIPFYIIVALPDGRNYWPKHVANAVNL